MVLSSIQSKSPVPLGHALQLLVGKHPNFAVRVKELPSNEIAGLPRVNVRFHYLTFRDGLASVDEFLEYLKDQLIYYCIPRKEREEARRRVAADQEQMFQIIPRLAEKAKRLFIEAKKGEDRSGEPGELILFVLVEWALGAPQIVSKMYLKTNRSMPVHGMDGIHAAVDANHNLVLYWGESKLHDDFSGALASALETVKNIQTNYDAQSRELDLVRDHHSFEDEDEQLVAAMLDYLDYKSPKSNQYSRCFACLLGFDFHAYEKLREVEPEKVEEEFVKHSETRIGSALALIKAKLEENNLGTSNFEFFLMPFPSVSSLRSRFYEVTGIQ
jgi:hypothetical protein